jgi:hypothetical protein
MTPSGGLGDRARSVTPTRAVQAGTVVVGRALTFYPWRLIVPTAAFIAVFAVVLSFGQRGDLRFYQAAATIIVVLVLSLSMQGHFFSLRALPGPPDWIARLGPRISSVWIASERFTVIGLLSYLGVGEAAALYALATGTLSAFLLSVAAAAIASGFFAIGTLALSGEEVQPALIAEPRPDSSPDTEGRTAAD